MLRDIVEKPIEMKQYFSSEAQALLRSLLDRNPVRRLGSSTADASDIMSHPFFRDINWQDLRERKIEPPYRPYVTSERDTSNIDKIFTSENPKETLETGLVTGSQKEKTQFKGFTYEADNLQKKK